MNTKDALEKFWSKAEYDENVEMFYYDIDYNLTIQIWYDYDGDLHIHIWDIEKKNRLTAKMVHEYDENSENFTSEQYEELDRVIKAKLEKALIEEMVKFNTIKELRKYYIQNKLIELAEGDKYKVYLELDNKIFEACKLINNGIQVKVYTDIDSNRIPEPIMFANKDLSDEVDYLEFDSLGDLELYLKKFSCEQ
jgi:signal recognition particle GTPase